MSTVKLAGAVQLVCLSGTGDSDTVEDVPVGSGTKCFFIVSLARCERAGAKRLGVPSVWGKLNIHL